MHRLTQGRSVPAKQARPKPCRRRNLAIALATLTLLGSSSFRPPAFAQTPTPPFTPGQGSWAGELRWQRQAVTLGDLTFPMTALEFVPQQSAIVLRPIWSAPTGMTGTEPLVTMARRWRVAAAINGGFFNRDRRLPLGALRRDGLWLSGPILNRGAIAWDDTGNFRMARLGWRERLITSEGQVLHLLHLNSGYVQAGVARYTPGWGPSYTPITDQEVISLVRGDTVVEQYQAGAAQTQAFPIPPDGYLLTIRSRGASPQVLAPGVRLELETQVNPPEFANLPQVVGAGPLLLQNRQIVLNAQAEGFSEAFARQAAPRSIIGRRADGTVVLAAFHVGSSGRGPTLAQTAQMLQRLGFTDALNLDGGSSTSLFLGENLIDRPNPTAARVHNGIGLYLSPASLP